MMFTGIIQAMGDIIHCEPQEDTKRITIASRTLDFSDIKIGDSIAVNGVCLTVIALMKNTFTADISGATQQVTVGLDYSHTVNLEKALRLSERLNGHLVSAHVDGVVEVTQFLQQGLSYLLEVKIPASLLRYIVVKGSICLDGVSLTVNEIIQDRVQINLIPHTLYHTTLRKLKVGDSMNVEIDMIARYVSGLLR